MKIARHLRPLVARVLVACGSAANRPVDAGQLAPDASASAAILFRVHVPPATPAGHVYLAGDFQGWDPESPAHRLIDVGGHTHELTLSFDPGTTLAFKVTRGSWETVEKAADGTELPNRTYEVTAPATLEVTVAAWADGTPSTSTRAGDVTTITVPGFLDGRRVWVYLPPGYHDTTARYPVLYLLDGQNVFDKATSFAGEWKVDETLEALIPAGEIAPLIVVAVDNGGGERIAEYTPWADGESRGGGGGEHLAAIADVLVPHIDATYRTMTGPASTGIGGSSLGGLMALYATFSRPDVFGVNAALSPSIWWADRRVIAFAAGSTKPGGARLWTDMGTAESGTSIRDLRDLREALVALGFVVGTDLQVVEEQGGGHNEAAWSRRFPDVVRFLFPPR